MLNFLFVSRNKKSFTVHEKRKNITFYPRAIDMWNDKIISSSSGGLDRIKNIIATQCHGSQQEADQISQYLSLFKRIASGATKVGNLRFKGSELRNQFEKDTLAAFLNDESGNKFINSIKNSVLSWKGSNTTETGYILEKFITDLVNAALESKGYSSTLLPVSKTRVPTRQIVGDYIVSNNQQVSAEAMIEPIVQHVKEELSLSLQGQAELKIKEIQNGTFYTATLRRGTSVQQKIDTIIPDLIFAIQGNGELDKFLRLISGKTFSAKNYSFSWSQRNVHMGRAIWPTRSYGSFYYAATGSQNSADIKTFTFGTIHSNSVPDTYKDWVNVLYEIGGIGQQVNNRLVDYIVINDNNNINTGMLVISMKEIFQAIDLSKQPNLVLDNNGNISVIRSRGMLQI